MKIVLRIPTPEQYSYVELELYPEEDWTPEQVRNAYEEYTSTFKFGGGLPQKEWNQVFDDYRRDKKMRVEEGERMNKAQSWLIHELDKSNLRLARLVAEKTGESVDSLKVKKYPDSFKSEKEEETKE